MKKKLLALCLVVVLAVTAVTGATLAYFTDTTEAVNNTFTMGKVEITLDEAKVDADGKEITGDGEDRVTTNTYTAKLVPGHEFDKDPTVHVSEGSEDSYIFLDMTINKYKSLVPLMVLNAQNNGADVNVNDYMVEGKFSTKFFLDSMKGDPALFRSIIDQWFIGINHENWKVCGFFYDVAEDDTAKQGNYLTIRFAYIGGKENGIVSEKTDIPFMDQFKMPASVTKEEIANNLTTNNFNTDGKAFVMNFKAYAIQADTLNTVTDAFAAMFGEANELGAYWNPVA